MNYILDNNRNPVLEPDPIKWGQWIEKNSRRVAETTIGNIWISTVFLGLDYSFGDDGPPVLWETMTFEIKPDGEKDMSGVEQDRCSGTWNDALAMHERMVEHVKLSQPLGEQPLNQRTNKTS